NLSQLGLQEFSDKLMHKLLPFINNHMFSEDEMDKDNNNNNSNNDYKSKREFIGNAGMQMIYAYIVRFVCFKSKKNRYPVTQYYDNYTHSSLVDSNLFPLRSNILPLET